eukprot:g13571.t1
MSMQLGGGPAAMATVDPTNAIEVSRDTLDVLCSSNGCQLVGPPLPPGAFHKYLRDKKTGRMSLGFDARGEGARLQALANLEEVVATYGASSDATLSCGQVKKGKARGKRSALPPAWNDSDAVGQPKTLTELSTTADNGELDDHQTTPSESAPVRSRAALPPVDTGINRNDTGGQGMRAYRAVDEEEELGTCTSAVARGMLFRVGGGGDSDGGVAAGGGGASATGPAVATAACSDRSASAAAVASSPIVPDACGREFSSGGAAVFGGRAAATYHGDEDDNLFNGYNSDGPYRMSCGTLITAKGNFLRCSGCGGGGNLKDCTICFHAFHLECLPAGSHSKLAVELQTDNDPWHCPDCTSRGRVNRVDGGLAVAEVLHLLESTAVNVLAARGNTQEAKKLLPMEVLAETAGGKFREKQTSEVLAMEGKAVRTLASMMYSQEAAPPHVLAAEAAERSREETEQKRSSNRRWNLRRLNAVETGQQRVCTLCRGKIVTGYLECDNDTARKAEKTNTRLRGGGVRARTGGHVTCFSCLKQRQHVELADVLRGHAKWDKCLACAPPGTATAPTTRFSARLQKRAQPEKDDA